MRFYIKREFELLQQAAAAFLNECGQTKEREPYAVGECYFRYYSRLCDFLDVLYSILYTFYQHPRIIMLDIDREYMSMELYSNNFELLKHSCFRNPSINFEDDYIIDSDNEDYDTKEKKFYFDNDAVECHIYDNFTEKRLKDIYNKCVELFQSLDSDGHLNVHQKLGIELSYSNFNEEINTYNILNPFDMFDFSILIITVLQYLQDYPKEEVFGSVFGDIMFENGIYPDCLCSNTDVIREALVYNRGFSKTEACYRRIMTLSMDQDKIWSQFMFEMGFDPKSLHFNVETAGKVLYENIINNINYQQTCIHFFQITDILYTLSKQIETEENRKIHFFSYEECEELQKFDRLHPNGFIDLDFDKQKQIFFEIALSIYRDYPRGKKLNLILILWWKWKYPGETRTDRNLFTSLMSEGNTMQVITEDTIQNMWESISHFNERDRLRIFIDPQSKILCVGNPKVRSKELLSEKEKEYSLLLNRIDEYMCSNDSTKTFNHNKVLKGEFEAWCNRNL